ncbi:Succinyl-CoA--L-malate CoA-transferase beta subunit [Fusarium oxysporum f. sp. albedinis]|nr:Succinyl-CoA--L-malate CoA-transferase beta subunit [Fusarium oxysporum f. sp. albedinis]
MLSFLTQTRRTRTVVCWALPRPSHKKKALPKGSEQCYMCLQFVGNIYSHVRECRGRCQNCVAKKVPCTRGNFAGHHKCKDYNAKDQDCGNSSHDKKGTCLKCLTTVHDMRTHRPYCQGQCGVCK